MTKWLVFDSDMHYAYYILMQDYKEFKSDFDYLDKHPFITRTALHEEIRKYLTNNKDEDVFMCIDGFGNSCFLEAKRVPGRFTQRFDKRMELKSAVCGILEQGETK